MWLGPRIWCGVHERVGRVRRATITLAPAIARLVAAGEDAVREAIHRFNEIGLADLEPRWAGGCPRRTSTEDEEFILATAAARPCKLGRPFTWWSLRRLVDYLARSPDRVVRIGRERLRQIVREHGISF
jgi:transposase